MSRKWFTRGITIAAIGALTAVAASGAEARTQRDAVGATEITEVAAPTALDQETYLATARGLLAGQPGATQSDADLIASGKSICADIDAGANSATFEQQIKDYGLDRAVYRTIIRTSILTFCPEDAAQIIR